MQATTDSRYSAACRRALDFSREQYAACLKSGSRPTLLSKEEDEALTWEERGAITRHFVDLLVWHLTQGYKGNENESENDAGGRG